MMIDCGKLFFPYLLNQMKITANWFFTLWLQGHNLFFIFCYLLIIGHSFKLSPWSSCIRMISQFVCVWEMFFPACILFFIFIFDVSLWENSWSIKICSILLNLLWINNILVSQCRKCLFNFMNFVIKGHFLCGCK